MTTLLISRTSDTAHKTKNNKVEISILNRSRVWVPLGIRQRFAWSWGWGTGDEYRAMCLRSRRCCYRSCLLMTPTHVTPSPLFTTSLFFCLFSPHSRFSLGAFLHQSRVPLKSVLNLRSYNLERTLELLEQVGTNKETKTLQYRAQIKNQNVAIQGNKKIFFLVGLQGHNFTGSISTGCVRCTR